MPPISHMYKEKSFYNVPYTLYLHTKTNTLPQNILCTNKKSQIKQYSIKDISITNFYFGYSLKMRTQNHLACLYEKYETFYIAN